MLQLLLTAFLWPFVWLMLHLFLELLQFLTHNLLKWWISSYLEFCNNKWYLASWELTICTWSLRKKAANINRGLSSMIGTNPKIEKKKVTAPCQNRFTLQITWNRKLYLEIGTLHWLHCCFGCTFCRRNYSSLQAIPRRWNLKWAPSTEYSQESQIIITVIIVDVDLFNETIWDYWHEVQIYVPENIYTCTKINLQRWWWWWYL